MFVFVWWCDVGLDVMAMLERLNIERVADISVMQVVLVKLHTQVWPRYTQMRVAVQCSKERLVWDGGWQNPLKEVTSHTTVKDVVHISSWRNDVHRRLGDSEVVWRWGLLLPPVNERTARGQDTVRHSRAMFPELPRCTQHHQGNNSLR